MTLSTDIILINNLEIVHYSSHAFLQGMVNVFNLFILDINQIKSHIINNNFIEKTIIFYMYYFDYLNGEKILKIINTLDLKCKIIIFSDDIWNNGRNENYNKILLSVNKWKVVTHMPNYKVLNDYAPCNITNSNILYFNYWCCYGNKNRIEFNDTPINKIGLGGRTWDCYKERYIISKFQNIELLPYHTQPSLKIKNTSEIIKYLKNPETKNIFIKRLSKYIACFTSSFLDTHCILMKVFEILSSGSLLLYPKKEEEYIKKIGLVDRHNCFLINFNENIQEQINFVLSYENREYINKIRKAGHEFSKVYNNTHLMLKFKNL